MSPGLLAAAEPRRTRGGAGGVRFNRPRRRSEQTVWVPESLYRGSEFCDEAVAVYVKISALDARRSFPGARRDQDPCTARVAELATMLGMSPSAVERGLTHLNRPGPGGTEPWVFTKQRTHRGGEGRSAKRYARLVPATRRPWRSPYGWPRPCPRAACAPGSTWPVPPRRACRSPPPSWPESCSTTPARAPVSR